MKARQLFERHLRSGPAAPEAPPTKPAVKPGVRPGAPTPTRPAPKYPNPFRRQRPAPGPLPRPKACEAKERPSDRWVRNLIRKGEEDTNTNPKSGLSHAPDCDCDVCEKRRQRKKQVKESAKSIIRKLR